MSEKVGFYNEKWFWAIICITLVEMYALSQGINGLMLGAYVAGIAGLGGYSIAKYRETERQIEEYENG